MTRLFNDPAEFAAEMTEGLVAANEGRLRRVGGGVARSRPGAEGKVALVTGGGSGHYPAFAGLVGPGLADGAAMGNLFASPSSRQVHSVARAVERGGGVLLSYGNYAGDVLNFDQAEASLNAEGIPTRTVTVTDDISSAPAAERHKRRGIAGDLCVFKTAGAAAESGYPLDEVWRVATAANTRTRSLGVAFSGCSLPGSPEPLFSVPEGMMAVGMGIHGEPGISMQPVPSADGLAQLLVEGLLAEVPEEIAEVDGARVAVLLNGLGSVKYEELFVVYRSVQARLRAAGLVIVEPEVGELVTSFDMAGVSLTLCWLDDELEALWRAPADAPAYKKGSMSTPLAEPLPDEPARREDDGQGGGEEPPQASAESTAAAAELVEALRAVQSVIDDNVQELGRIDAVAGDGDHGIGMQRGSTAAVAAAEAAQALGAGAGSTLAQAAAAWADRAGGTSGAIWGALLEALAAELGDEHAPDARTLLSGIRSATAAVLAFGARPGDKTMVDALQPFAEEFAAAIAAGSAPAGAWMRAARAAQVGAEGTALIPARLGRARTHGQNSIGTPDAGAVSFALIVGRLVPILAKEA